MSTRPWLLLDVDGVLNILDVSSAQARERELLRCTVFGPHGGRYVVNLDPEHGRMLREIGRVFRLGWATTWNQDANDQIGPLLGLPALPVALVSGPNKAPGILDLVGDEPFVWIDDVPATAAIERLDADHRRYLVVTTDPTVGLAAEHLERAVAWAAQL